MLIIYVNDLHLAELEKLQTLLDDTVTLRPLSDHLIAVKCDGKIRAYLTKLPVLNGEFTQAQQACLSPREQTVMDMLKLRLNNRQISELLDITEKTVEKHVSSILRKLKLTSRADTWINPHIGQILR